MNIRKIIADDEKAIKKEFHHLFEKKKKKKIVFFLVSLALVFLVSSLFFRVFHQRQTVNERYPELIDNSYGGTQRRLMEISNFKKSSSYDDSFAIPQDAAEEGELAIAVTDFNGTRDRIMDISKRSDGEVYSSHIAHTLNNIKSGIMVVQVPSDQFEKTFSSLRLLGERVFQESTQKIEINSPDNLISGAQIAPVEIKNGDADMGKQADDANKSQSDIQKTSLVGELQSQQATKTVTPDPSVYYPRKVQNKGYVRVVFVDYSENPGLIYADSFDVSISNTLWFVFAVKTILLIALIGLVSLILVKIFRFIHGCKAGKKRR